MIVVLLIMAAGCALSGAWLPAIFFAALMIAWEL